MAGSPSLLLLCYRPSFTQVSPVLSHRTVLMFLQLEVLGQRGIWKSAGDLTVVKPTASSQTRNSDQTRIENKNKKRKQRLLLEPSGSQDPVGTQSHQEPSVFSPGSDLFSGPLFHSSKLAAETLGNAEFLVPLWRKRAFLFSVTEQTQWALP